MHSTRTAVTTRQEYADQLDRISGELDGLYQEGITLGMLVVARAVHDAAEAMVRARALAYEETRTNGVTG